MKVREKIWPWFFKGPLKEHNAITLYPFIIYRSDQAKRELQAHEFAHVQQVRRHGWFKFYFSYLNESRKKGYWHNKYELEAREHNHENHKDRI